jgi:hypothetical protein
LWDTRSIAPFAYFPTVDLTGARAAQLARDNPERFTVREVGRSRQGDAIQLVSVGRSDATTSALVIGQPHPNEPIGMATIITIWDRLLADGAGLEGSDVAWHFVPCADPDGTRLNEGWFAGPWTRAHYARNFFRPGAEQQVEWTFPFAADGFAVDAPMPETRALMAAIDAVRPNVLASLHNAEMGGAYYYVSPADDALYARLAQVCEERRIPLHRGEPETPLTPQLAPAVYKVPRAREIYDFATAAGLDPSLLVSGGSSLDYASRHGDVFGLAIELPYWRDRRATDQSPDAGGQTRRAVVVGALDVQEASNARVRELFDAASPPASPFSDALLSFLRVDEGGYIDVQRQQAETDAEFERPATVAEVFTARDECHMLRLRMAGMLLRAMADDSPARPDAEATFTAWCDEAAADDQADPVPIADLVGVQAAAIGACVDYVRG